ncbi:MAG: tRNA uridine-5-carboxymethylaminomethyl(34) synthesis enzyme MnmG [Prevotellaceae bacterium]|jgi:tRNA uridine 5-carboxymethylaminomethyl modification enzyme|nr:tRNA uridine-5-carboxymethylaminomethyl(34) synthesis enzyme MnmG [Prevotellaceae bacterium]
MIFKYDVIVIGGGHAGCEAACAAARLGSRTLLITMNMNTLGQMSCNPAVGGIAKGQIVREIDALGGQMGIITDKTAIQFRMLNRSKGPAMWSPRSQSDRARFVLEWIDTVTHTPNLFVWQDAVTEILFANNAVVGAKTALGAEFRAKSVALTAGTFLNGLMHFGQKQIAGGRISETASFGVTEQLKSMGFVAGRMKTGTPCRIDGKTIDFNRTTEQVGDNDFHKFSFLPTVKRELPQHSCFITYTNEKTHDILRRDLQKSPLYNGQIKSVGPRYCPSIETKIVTFADKTSHQLFLEPEGVNSNEFYLNGFSSSLPVETQIEAINTIAGLEQAKLFRPGYAIEYDFFDTTQLKHNLETKMVDNLFFAGQINGTTGYEEAAGQGIIAGINAHLRCHSDGEFTLARSEAYIGVLIDDLVTKGVDEPYRMFSSRAEYRLLLRQDDADRRLTQKSYNLGLSTKERFDLLMKKTDIEKELTEFLVNHSVKPHEINFYLQNKNSSELRRSCKISEILVRPQICLVDLIDIIPALKEKIYNIHASRRDEIVESVEIKLKYDGYIKREKLIADKLQRLEHIYIKDKIDYNAIRSLSTEARQKLTRINPDTIGQASRISGISPSDISVLLVLMGR